MGKKIAFTSSTLTLTETKLWTFYTIKTRPASPTCNLYGSLPRRGGGGGGGGGWVEILCCYVLTVVVASWVTRSVVGTVLLFEVLSRLKNRHLPFQGDTLIQSIGAGNFGNFTTVAFACPWSGDIGTHWTLNTRHWKWIKLWIIIFWQSWKKNPLIFIAC